MSIRDVIRHKTEWRIRKFNNDSDWKANKPYAESRFKGNILLNEGIDEMNLLIAGTGSPVAWDSTYARLGVGSGNAAESASHTGLQGASKFYKVMDGGYPTTGTQKITWRTTFDAGEASFAWEEFTVCNTGSDAGDNLNRKISAEGTKGAAKIWELTLEITFS